MPAKKADTGFTAEERAAMKERVREMRRPKAEKSDGEQEILAKIAEMSPTDRALAERIHSLVKAAAPNLTCRTWYGMPAYAKDGEIVCFFQNSGKFKVRYSTLGFSDEAKLDEGNVWPVTYAVTQLTPADEQKIIALVKKAVG